MGAQSLSLSGSFLCLPGGDDQTPCPEARMGAGSPSPLTDGGWRGAALRHPNQGVPPSLLCLGEGRGGGSSLARGRLAVGLSPGSDASSSLPTILVPPHLGPGRPREPQGAVAALPQEEPLPRGGGPCLPLLVSIGAQQPGSSPHPHGTVPCPAHCIVHFCPSPMLGPTTPPS